MADITKCGNTACPLFAQCYRAQAQENGWRQSFAMYQFQTENGVTKCDLFWPNEIKYDL